MKQNLWSPIACTRLLLFSLSTIQAAPQYHDDDAWHQFREQYFFGDNWRTRMFNRIHMDLDHVQEIAFGRGDEDRIVMTREKVSELQDRMAAGRYDQAEPDEVIASLEKVVADNSLASRDRDMLSDDLSRVRDYRASHDNWH
jgi:hypothetical protein